METIEVLEIKLYVLREKWRKSWPKSARDKRWWKFRCDKTLALRYENQIKLLRKSGELSKKEVVDVAQLIFGEVKG